MIPFFDLHCDTFTELYKNNYSIIDSPLHISLKKASSFSPYIQVCAIWSNCKETDEQAFETYQNCIKYLKRNDILFSTSVSKSIPHRFILSVEDIRILNNNIDRLITLYNDGVRIVTLSWKGSSCICGGWDTSLPLTEFGRRVVKKCVELGICIDLSHSSIPVQDEIINLAYELKFSPIYSHSNSFSVCPHMRNITDFHAKNICDLNGLIGISLYAKHLSLNGIADFETVIDHIKHFLNIGCENVIAFGCDFDGIDELPSGIGHIGDLTNLFIRVKQEFGTKIAEKLFFSNAFGYFNRILKGG